MRPPAEKGAEVGLCPLHPAKASFPDRISAEIRLAKLRHPSTRDTASGTVPKRSYHCPGCGAWHLTSKPKASDASRPRVPDLLGSVTSKEKRDKP